MQHQQVVLRASRYRPCQRRSRAWLDGDRRPRVLGVRAIVLTTALTVNRPASETRQASEGDKNGKRQMVALTATAIRNATTAAAVMTFPCRAVTFISRLACRSSVREPITAPTSLAVQLLCDAQRFSRMPGVLGRRVTAMFRTAES
jgi:hypothetical protein